MEWNKPWRGSDSVYGESIYTGRWELIGMYQLPVKEKIMAQFSYNRHNQILGMVLRLIWLAGSV